MQIDEWWRHILLGAPPPAGFYALVRPRVADPLDIDDVLDAHKWLEESSNLRDLGIGSLTWWRMGATCGRHGRLSRYEETTGGPPLFTTVLCHLCKKEGLTRPCLVDELDIVVGKQAPILGKNEDGENIV